MCVQSYQFEAMMKSFQFSREPTKINNGARIAREKKNHNNIVGKYLIFHVTDYLTKIHTLR